MILASVGTISNSKSYKGNSNDNSSKRKSNPRLALAQVCSRSTVSDTGSVRCIMARVLVNHKKRVQVNEGSHDQDTRFVIDSGAIHNMCSDANLFRIIRIAPTFNVTLGHNNVVQGEKAGEVDILLSKPEGSEDKGVWSRRTNLLLFEQI